MGKRSTPQPTRANSPSVIGLEHGRKHAAKQAKRKSRSNAIKTGTLAVLAAAAVGLAGYAVFDYYESEQEREAENRQAPTDMDEREAIEILENQPRWNGPGNPAFGVGEAPAEQP